MQTREEKETEETYDAMAHYYHEYRTSKFKGGWFFNEYLEMPAMLKALGNVKGKKVLDWGCGSGIYAKILSKREANVKGFDISKEMLKIAKRDNPHLDLRVGSGYKIPFKEKFDIVFSSLALHYLKDFDKAFKEVHRVLNKGGVFLFSVANPIVDASVSIKHKGEKVKVLGRRGYFAQAAHTADWKLPNGKTVVIKSYEKTYEYIIRTINKTGFEIADYIDIKPIASAKNKFPKEYALWSKIPKFVIWKIRKK
jgi:ubiquinone/menaquinone biosynthesis C-methylase UbiE